jgi:hypothetical protein
MLYLLLCLLGQDHQLVQGGASPFGPWGSSCNSPARTCTVGPASVWLLVFRRLVASNMRMGAWVCPGWWWMVGRRDQSAVLHHASRRPTFPSPVQQYKICTGIACGRWLGPERGLSTEGKGRGNGWEEKGEAGTAQALTLGELAVH